MSTSLAPLAPTKVPVAVPVMKDDSDGVATVEVLEKARPPALDETR